MKKVLFLIVFLSEIIGLYAQQTNNDEVIIGNKIYKYNTNWFKISQGIGYHFSLGQIEYNTLLSYSFRIKKYWFQAGYHVSCDRFFIKPSMQRLNDIFLLYGKRKEFNKYNIAAFAGLSYAYGGTFHHAEWNDGRITQWYLGFTQPGFICSIDLTYKPVFDLGIGTSLFASFNKRYNILGIQIHIFLSGAYKGKIE
ncbi:MAG: hypothetical protein N2449_07125 [Bacteroidales bacterium]|nr:hypothetical protein [Bacteroidales bacterium]